MSKDKQQRDSKWKVERKIKCYSKQIIKNSQKARKGIHVKLFHENLRIRTASGELQL